MSWREGSSLELAYLFRPAYPCDQHIEPQTLMSSLCTRPNSFTQDLPNPRPDSAAARRHAINERKQLQLRDTELSATYHRFAGNTIPKAAAQRGWPVITPSREVLTPAGDTCRASSTIRLVPVGTGTTTRSSLERTRPHLDALDWTRPRTCRGRRGVRTRCRQWDPRSARHSAAPAELTRARSGRLR